jgi:hypothetical protein
VIVLEEIDRLEEIVAGVADGQVVVGVIVGAAGAVDVLAAAGAIVDAAGLAGDGTSFNARDFRG